MKKIILLFMGFLLVIGLSSCTQVTTEDIKLSGCELTKKAGDIEWCMKNSQLIKNVEGYETKFKKSSENDKGLKGIYETENEDKLYTFEYLEMACGTIKEGGLLIDKTVKETCPCPIGYHVPTSKEWTDTYSFYKADINLFKSELGFDKIVWNRDTTGHVLKGFDQYGLFTNGYQTSILGSESNSSQYTLLQTTRLFISERGGDKGIALTLRCIKNN